MTDLLRDAEVQALISRKIIQLGIASKLLGEQAQTLDAPTRATEKPRRGLS
jgi:hypothetical protein